MLMPVFSTFKIDRLTNFFTRVRDPRGSFRTKMLSVVAICCLPLLASAQDARFNNINASGQLTNPALTGMMAGEFRFTAAYRQQYSTLLGPDAFKSYAAGFEMRRPAGNGNFFGLGVTLQQDEAGNSDFQRTQGLISGSYQQHIGGSYRRNEGSFLVGGVQAGFGQRGYDLNKLWFSNQYFVDAGTREAYIDRTLPTGEAFSGAGSGAYLDLNAGLGWFGSFGDRMGAYAGVAAYHLNRPNVSPLPGGTDDLDVRYVVHGGGELPLGKGEMSLLPAGRLMLQGPGYEAMLGASVRYTERQWREVALRLGLYAQGSNQSGDSFGLNAYVFSVGLETERLQFGLNYDISTGDLNVVTNGRGGFELGVVYLLPASYRDKVICPKF